MTDTRILRATLQTAGAAVVAFGFLCALGFFIDLPHTPTAGATTRSSVRVHWQRKTFEPGAWPVEFPEEGRALVEAWEPWARVAGYRMDLTSDLRVMHLSSARHNRSVRRVEGRIEDTLEAFDALTQIATDERRSRGDDALPEPQGRRAATVVLLRLHERADYLTALDFLAEGHPYLADWASGAGSGSGFVLRRPLCAAWIENNRQVEEWRPENELVNRLANCLTHARFGEPPYWLGQGTAWNVELEVCGSIHCFPFRNGFVGVEEHDGWQATLKDAYRKRKGLVLRCADFAVWERGTYDDLQAGMAWGMVAFLAEHAPGSLGAVLRELGTLQRSGARRTHADGSWEVVAGYQVPAEAQHEVLTRLAGRELWQECTRFFQEGKRYRRFRR